MTDQPERPARTMREYNTERRARQCSPACSEQHTYEPPCQLVPAEARTADGEGPTPAGTVDNPDPLREQYAAAIRDAACTGNCGMTEDECSRQRIQPVVWHWGRLAEVSGSPELLADAVLAVRDTELQQLRERASLAQRIARSAARDAAGALTRQLVVEAALARVAALADEHPAGIDTALVLEALDGQAVEDPEKQQLRAQVARARAFAEEMRDYCSPHGVSVMYADRLDAALDDQPAPRDR